MQLTTRINFNPGDEEILGRIFKEAMIEIKRMYSNEYTLSKEDQKRFASGKALSSCGKPVKDTKRYFLRPIKPKEATSLEDRREKFLDNLLKKLLF